MKLSDYIVEFLKENKVDTVFGYQGGAITHLVDSIYKAEGIEFMSLYHEQAAAFAAEGYARVSGNIGAAIATSGPGATNLITGIGSCFFDSIPCLFITGQVNTYEYKRSDEIRQEGFQETDIVSIVKPVTKFAAMVTDAKLIRFYLEKAVYTAKEGRPGPVLIDIPMDIQRAQVEPAELESFFSSEEYKSMKRDADIEGSLEETLNLIKQSERPVILAGGGIRISGACEALETFAETTGIPVVTTLMGLDSFDHYKEEYAGFLGAYGNRYANLAVANADLLLVFGSRLTSRQTSTKYDSFARKAKIVHVDIDRSELNRRIKADLSVNADIKLFLDELNARLLKEDFTNKYDFWKEKISGFKKQYPSYPTQKEINNIDPNEFMAGLSEMLGEDAVICADVGQNQIWAAQSLKLRKSHRLLNSGGMGAMGFALPSGIGAYKASPNSKIVVIAGDGGIQMNIQEFQTVVREKIPAKIFIVNNKALGMIRHFQEMYFDSKYYGTIEGYSTPDFVEVGKAYGIESFRISDYEGLSILKEKLADDKCHIFDIDLKNITYVIPKLGMGRPIEDQEPLVDRQELEENMIIEIYK